MRGIRMELEIIRRRRLLWELVKRDLRMRYVGSVMGLFWSVINPLIMLIIYIFIFSLIFQFGSDGGTGKGKFKDAIAYFPVYLCCGLLPWNALMESLLSSTNVIANSGGLIKRSVFPIAILPMQSIVASFVSFAITLVLLGIFLLVLGADHFPGISFLMVGPLMVLQFIFIVGGCYFFATVNVFYRDMSQILFAVLNFLFWASPIVYPAFLPVRRFPATRILFLGNPISHLVRLYREFLYTGHQPGGYEEFGMACPLWVSVLYLLLTGAIGYIIGKYVFTRSQPHFVDEV
jgi:ABC-type polysaccharide/polyol phosphate export permease